MNGHWTNPRVLSAAFGLATALCLGSGGASAGTITCRAVDGAATVSLDVALPTDDDSPGTVTRVDADLGDFTMSTHPADSDTPAERIESQASGPGRLDLYLTDPDDVWIVLRLRLVRDITYKRQYGDESDENSPSVVAGTLSVMGAGIWAVTCEGW